MMPQVFGRNTMKELVTSFNCLLKVFNIYCIYVWKVCSFKTCRALELNTWVVFREDTFPAAKAKKPWGTFLFAIFHLSGMDD
jgi:hypothetical protein